MCGFVQGSCCDRQHWGCTSLGPDAPVTADRQHPTRAAASTVTATLSDISADEEVVFFPTAAHFDEASHEWIVPIHGIIYEPEQDSRSARSS